MSNIRGQDEYELQPELPPGPRWRPIRPIRTAMLEYEPKTVEFEPSVSPVLQAVVGVIFPLVYWGMYFSIMDRSRYSMPLFWAALIVFVGIVVYVRGRLQWTGFVPGMLFFFFVLPLLLFLTCGALVAGGAFISAIK